MSNVPGSSQEMRDRLDRDVVACWTRISVTTEISSSCEMTDNRTDAAAPSLPRLPDSGQRAPIWPHQSIEPPKT